MVVYWGEPPAVHTAFGVGASAPELTEGPAMEMNIN